MAGSLKKSCNELRNRDRDRSERCGDRLQIRLLSLLICIRGKRLGVVCLVEYLAAILPGRPAFASSLHQIMEYLKQYLRLPIFDIQVGLSRD